MKARPSAEKRRRERERQARRREKLERLARRRGDQAKGPRCADGEDPDIAGIVPGPQPPMGEEADTNERSRAEDGAGPGGPEPSRSPISTQNAQGIEPTRKSEDGRG